MSAAAQLLRRRGAASLLRALLPWGRVVAGDACRVEAGACAATPPQPRGLHASAASCGASAHSTAAPGVVSAQQMRVAAAVRRALSTALNSGALAARFMQGSGFAVLEVRMTPDLRRAYIRWDAVPGQVARTERELTRSAVPLRNAVAKLVGLKHTPELHFRRNAVSPEEERLKEVWRVLERERMLEEQEGAEDAAPHDDADDDAPPAAPPAPPPPPV